MHDQPTYFQVGDWVAWNEEIGKDSSAFNDLRTELGEGPFQVVAVRDVDDIPSLHQMVTIRTKTDNLPIRGDWLIPHAGPSTVH